MIESVAERDRLSLTHFLDGDEQGFMEFFQRHSSGLYNFVYRFLNNEQQAEDITQEAFMKFLEKIKKLDFKYAPSTFLYRIGKNLCLDLIKSKYMNKTQLIGNDDMGYFKNAANLQQSEFSKKEIHTTINNFINSMDPKMKTIYLLKSETDLTFQEISKTTSIPIRSVNRYLKNTLESIVLYLKKCGFTIEDLS